MDPKRATKLASFKKEKSPHGMLYPKGKENT
jgi:hypothetical protein